MQRPDGCEGWTGVCLRVKMVHITQCESLHSTVDDIQ